MNSGTQSQNVLASQSRDAESKEEEDFNFPVTYSALDLSDGSLDQGLETVAPPPREQVVQLLRSLHHEQLVELLAPYVMDDTLAYAKLVRETETDVHRRKLFVHGLPARTTEDQFRIFFEQYGDVELVELPHAKAHSEVKFGFVVFKSVHALQAALEQPNKQFEGKEICCKVFTVRSGSLESSPASSNQAASSSALHRKIFVSGLAPFVADRELHDHFRSCGEIEVAQVSPGKSSGYVLFTDHLAAKEAVMRMNRTQLGGRQIAVAWYRKQEDVRYERRAFVANPQMVRSNVQPSFPSPNLGPAYATAPASGWYNYHPYVQHVQQDPYLLVPMPVFQSEFHVDSFFGSLDEQDAKQLM
jgi:RNA recognition motif-containing protein